MALAAVSTLAPIVGNVVSSILSNPDVTENIASGVSRLISPGRRNGGRVVSNGQMPQIFTGNSAGTGKAARRRRNRMRRRSRVTGVRSSIIQRPPRNIRTTVSYRPAPFAGQYGALQNQVNEMLPAESDSSAGDGGINLINAPGGSIVDIPQAMRHGATMKSFMTERKLTAGDPFPHMFEQGTCIDGQELLFILDSTNWASTMLVNPGQTIASFILNPLNFTGSRLVKIAQQYQRYCFDFVEVIYTPDVAVTEPGSFLMGWLTDASRYIDDESVSGIRQLSELTQAEKFSVSQPTSMTKRLALTKAEPYYCRASPSDTVVGSITNQAKLVVKTGASMGKKQYGSFHLKYRVYFYDPINLPSESYQAISQVNLTTVTFPAAATRGEAAGNVTIWVPNTLAIVGDIMCVSLFDPIQSSATPSDGNWLPGMNFWGKVSGISGAWAVIAVVYPSYVQLCNATGAITSTTSGAQVGGAFVYNITSGSAAPILSGHMSLLSLAEQNMNLHHQQIKSQSKVEELEEAILSLNAMSLNATTSKAPADVKQEATFLNYLGSGSRGTSSRTQLP